MRVVLRSTGQVGQIPDDKFDPSLFSVPSEQPTTAPTQTPSIQDASQPQSQGGNSLLNFLLPTAGGLIGGLGGAMIPVAGETGIPEVAGYSAGAAGGQALADILQGKNPGLDVAGQAVGGALGGAAGVVGGKVLGGILGGLGEDLSTGGLNLTKSQLAKFAATHGEDLSSVLKRNNLSGADLDTLSNGISQLQDTYNGIINKSDTPIDPNSLYTNMKNTVSNLRNSSVESNKSLADQVEQNFTNVTGKLGESPNLSDINGEKIAFDKATNQSQFGSSQWGANRIVGDTLRKTLNQSADQAGLTAADGTPLSKIGTDLMKLRDVAETAAGRVGVGSNLNPLNLTNLVLGGEGGAVAGALGANPLLGAILPAARIGYGALKSNPGVAGAASSALSGVGNVLTKAVPALGLGGALAGGASTASLVGESTGPNSQTNEQNNNENSNQSSGSISQAGKDASGNYVLPTLNATNPVPQVYPTQNYLNDLQRFGNNPIAMERANAAYKASQDQAQQYIQSHALQGPELQFMQTAGQTNEMMNTLRGLLKDKGNANVFQAVLSDIPPVQYARAQSDPKYAQMLAIMSSLKGAAVRAVEGGRPSNFDIKVFNNAPAPGDTASTAMAKLDQAQQFLVDQYKRNLPAYTYSLMGNQQTAQSIPQVQDQTVPQPLLQQILGLPGGQ